MVSCDDHSWHPHQHSIGRKGHDVTTGAPNIVLVMSDQHRADMMGCAGDASALTPSLDALAAQGVRFSRVSCQGPLCMPARASFMTERYVRDHGVYTNSSEIPPDSPTYAWALREAGYHTVAPRQGTPLPRRAAHRVAHGRHGRTARGARLRRGLRDGRQVRREDPDPLHRLPLRSRAARRLQEAHRRPQLPGRERGRSERDQVRADVGLHSDAHPAASPTSTPGTASRPCDGSRATTAPSRSSSSWASRGRTIPGTRRQRPCSGTAASTSQCPARHGVPRSRARAATGRC